MDVSHSHGHDGRRGGLDLPRPFRSGGALAAVGVIPLALGVTGVIRPLSGIVFAGLFVLAGALQWSLAYYELVGTRRRADVELRSRRRPFLWSNLARWRVTELTSERHRTALARAVTRTARDLSPSLLPGASPLNRVAARPNAELFVELADRLAAVNRPVTPQAILQVEELMTSPDSPLYARERAGELRASLLACLRTLDVLPDGASAEPAPAAGQRQLPVNRNGKRPMAGKTSRAPRASMGQLGHDPERVVTTDHRSER